MSNPFEFAKVYGPYLSKAELRRMVTIVFPDSRTTMSYARYLMCCKLQRLLGADEEVDHIDNNKLNDDLSNLQILTPAENRLKGRQRQEMVTLTCPYCGVDFTRPKRQTHLTKGGAQTFCSRSCAARQQHLEGRSSTV